MSLTLNFKCSYQAIPEVAETQVHSLQKENCSVINLQNRKSEELLVYEKRSSHRYTCAFASSLEIEVILQSSISKGGFADLIY